jgi:hypothetical protein
VTAARRHSLGNAKPPTNMNRMTRWCGHPVETLKGMSGYDSRG